ncbi:hypothetical protein AKJ09_01567 [Labilithrix luteola]|uniref:Uncharacterized protein n=1 Tax=Labilithrix luteola TaxID=1391654 RepID=A0A0K1PMZ8_9BACT|nr:hypothetical protein [Labilithrix luteola]AKU94903.1 hypothetical protein AKJ09_01567 [Labilithrix luteola]
MKNPIDPSDLADAELDADVARLLGSFEDEAPPPGAAARLLALADTVETGDDGSAAPRSSWTSLKTLAAVGGLLVTAGLCVVASRREQTKLPSAVDAPAAITASVTASPVIENPHEGVGPVETAPAASPMPVVAASALPSAPAVRTTPNASAGAGQAESKDSFREQLAIVESARHSLSEKKADECLETLRRYDTKYPSGIFTTEVQVVRVEALMTAGQSEKAFALARKLIAENPRGAYADRLRALLPKTDGLDR